MANFGVWSVKTIVYELNEYRLNALKSFVVRFNEMIIFKTKILKLNFRHLVLV
jgi:hypothetical protein